MYNIEKFQCIIVNADEHNVEILATFYSFAETLEFMTHYIAQNYELSDYLKVYHNNEQSVSIYQYYRIWSKKLLAKLHIVKYNDITKVEKY